MTMNTRPDTGLDPAHIDDVRLKLGSALRMMADHGIGHDWSHGSVAAALLMLASLELVHDGAGIDDAMALLRVSFCRAQHAHIGRPSA